MRHHRKCVRRSRDASGETRTFTLIFVLRRRGGGEFEDGICIPFVVPLDARVLLGSSFRFQPSIATSSVISRPIDSDGDSLMLELDCHAIATGYPSGLIGFQGIDSVHAIRVQGRTCAPGYVTFTRDAQRRRLSSLLRRGARARLRQERKWPPPSSRRHFLRDPSHFPFIRRPARARLNVKVIHSSSVFYESRPRRTLNPDLSLSLSLSWYYGLSLYRAAINSYKLG